MSRKGRPTLPGAWTPPPRESMDADSDEPSPPRTPPAQIGRGGRSTGGATTARTSAPRGDEARPGAEGDPLRARSDSHDLSWSPQRQRRSVLENMLLSLDQAAAFEPLSSGAMSAGLPRTTEPSTKATHRHTFSTPPDSRSRANTGSSDISEIYHLAIDTQNRATRAHRSNSSRDYQSGLARIDSVRHYDETTQEGDTYKAVGALRDAPKAGTSTGGRRRGSHGSGSSSVDLGQTTGVQWQHNAKRRSRSFDQGYVRPEVFASMARPALLFASAEDQATASAIYNSFEAAPMPTVPGGPRLQADSLPTSPLYDDDLAAEGSGEGGRGFRPPKAFFARTERSQSPKRGETRTEKPDRPSTLRHGHSYDEAAHAPEGLEVPEQSRANIGPPIGSAPPFGGQRPGFFRRVFNSAKGSPGPSDATFSPSARTVSESAPSGMGRSEFQGAATFPDGSFSTPNSARDGKKSKKIEKDRDTPPLNKKPSFFRRRKKSVSQTVPIPDMPPRLQAELPTSQPSGDELEASPSSLRQALDSYLVQPRPLDAELRASRRSQDDSSRERGTYDTMGQRTIRPVHRPDETALVVSDSPRYKASGRQDGTPQGPAHRTKNSKDLTLDLESTRPENATERSIRHSFAQATTSQQIRANSDALQSGGSPSLAQKEKVNSNSPRSPKSGRTKAKKNSVDHRTPSSLTTTTADAKTLTAEDRKDSLARSPKMNSNAAERPGDKLWIVPDSQHRDTPPRPPLNSPSAVSAPPFITSIQPPFYPGNSTEASVSEVSDPETSELKQSSAPEVVEQHSAPESVAQLDFPPQSDSDITNEDRERAQRLFNGSDSIDRGDAAAWLGEEGPERARIRKAYMELFDWSNRSILGAMRSFCSQTRLKGETQQVDRVLDTLSARWCECNPNHGFKATDVVHTICYSILLLNTDLHMADIEQKMTRNQFIKNTLPTIQRVVDDAVPNAFQDTRPVGVMPPPTRPPPAAPSDMASPNSLNATDLRRPSLTHRPSNLSESETANYSSTAVDRLEPTEDCGPLVRAPFTGKQSAWESQVETVLKNFYLSVRQERLPLFGSDTGRGPARPQPSSASLPTGGLRRSNSIVSKAGSDNFIVRGRLLDGRLGSRWSSKTRSRPRLYPSPGHAQSTTSFDDDAASAISPTASSLWSRASFGRTQASMSVNSFTPLPSSDFHQSIGFANALSQAIIREETVGDGDDNIRARPLLEDESLELDGAPWAKEGIVKHKHHLESVDKKAKDRSWVECFAVVEKGWMRLFQFNVNARSLRQKTRGKQMAGGVVGGGNWTENAEPLGAYLLRQSIATALPPPGYSKSRPHVWALSLPTGAVHLFQAGTPEIVKEFVSTANYWSARMSKEPLVGGVSNVEYGWSDAVINMALVQDSRPSVSTAGPRPSVQGSIRSSFDQQNAARPRLPADRIHINDWSPPMQSTMPSKLVEAEQLTALATYVSNVEQELKRHNELRGAMALAFTPRTPNCIKALNNWERKSSYLLQEIVKFSTYIESLKAAQVQQEKIYAEREEREREKDRAAEAQGLAALEGTDSSSAIEV